MASIPLLISTLVFFIHLNRGEACETGWQSYGANCFLFRNRKVHEFLAEMECQRNGGSLATITSEEKLTFLKQQELVIANGGDFWVGLHVTNEGNPYWNDYVSTPVLNVSMNDYHRMDTNCFAYINETIQAVHCRKQLTFICEQPIVAVEPVCPRNTSSSHLSNLCFWSQTSVSWSEAKNECARYGGEVCGYRELLRGGFRLVTTNYVSAHYWVKGTFKDESHNETDTPKCHTIKFNPNTVVLYIQDECDKTYNVLCYREADNETSVTYEETEFQLETAEYVTQTQTTVTTEAAADLRYECPHGYNWKEDRSTGMCYWETSYEAPRRSWEDAQTFCESYGGKLASFHNINEERLGLSFQYGTTQHPYWIGLKYNYSTSAYQWIDGSPLDYENWGPGEPKDYPYRRKCVQMNALSTHWVASYCGQISWFVCKAPKQVQPEAPVQPTLSPIETCPGDSSDSFFNGHCYSIRGSSYTWDRAHIYCTNLGYDLVSVHSYNELDFLLRMCQPLRGNNADGVWIGLHSLTINGSFIWADGTSLDFAHWDLGESGDFATSRACVSMNATTGLWNSQNCNIGMRFVCKRRNGTGPEFVPTATLPPPVVGNCEDGWYALGDRCYSLFGDDDPKSWTRASSICDSRGSKLASIRNRNEQALLAFMIQDLKKSTWIGLHDRVIEGIFTWSDHSPMSFSNFAPGEPSFHQLEEDCISMGYDSVPSVQWYARNCSLEKPFICSKRKNAAITEYTLPKQNRCPYPEGWLRHGMSCYKFFNTSKNHHLATLSCAEYHARLVSISDLSTETVVNYLSMNANSTFWIGLVVEEDSSIRWSNEVPLSISRWSYNQPSLKLNSQNCFVSSFFGLWNNYDCEGTLPYICQTTSGQPTQPAPKRKGSCPSRIWSDLGDDNCYIFNAEVETNWYEGSMKCNREGGRYASIHSMKQVELLKKNIDSEIGIHIGLTRNENGGFMWMDGTAVDFVYWDQGEPSSNNNSLCVSMLPGTLKWRVRKCDERGNYLCQISKEVSTDAEQSERKQKEEKDSVSKLSGGAIAAIVLSLLVLSIGAVALYSMYPRLLQKYRPKAYFRASSQVVGFENEMYKGEMDDTLHNRKDSSLFMEE